MTTLARRCAETRTSRVLALVCVLFTGCSGSPATTPEDEIRQLIAAMEEAAEQKDIATLKEHISESYKDDEGRTKQDLKGILAYYFLQNRSIYLLTRVRSIEFPAPDAAEVVVFVAMASTQIPDAAWLPRLSADLYRFDVTLRRDGKWKLVRAKWQPATEDDFK